MYISSGSTTVASSAIVHTTQSREVTQSSYERDPLVPLRPIVEDESVPFGARDNFSSPITGEGTAGHHINLTV
jgi:hypothetical protein